MEPNNMEMVLSFANTHHAIRGEQLLLEAGVAVKVMPLPPAIHAGCGICLRVAPEELRQAWEALGAGGVPVEGLFSREERDGKDVYNPVGEAF